MALFSVSAANMLQQALLKITTDTAVTSTSPGSVARAFTEAITTQLGNFYSILDFNLSQYNLSTASGRSIDLIGSLYNVQRKTISTATATDASLGAFYFFINTPYSSNITIPAGTLIYTDNTTYIGQQFTYATTTSVTIPVGQTKVYASIIPQFTNSIYTAGANTLVVMDPNFAQPVGTTVQCTNPKPIQAQVGQESDNSYRFRIQQAVRTAAGGTLTAVRMTGLNIPGVRDITILEAPYGLGSFSAVIVPEDNTSAAFVLTTATSAMDAVRPVGSRMFTTLPNLLPVDVSCTIVLTQDVTANATINQNSIASGVQVSIMRFLNIPLVGSPLIYNELIQNILNSSQSVSDVTITNLAVNGTPILFQNYMPAADSQLVPGAISVSIAS